MPDRTSAADGGYFTPLASASYMLLTTFERDGMPVSTSVCGVIDGDRAYFCVRKWSGTVKRLRHTDAVQVTPCGVRGFVTHGPPLDAVARPLSGEDASLVAAKLDRRYLVRHRFLIRLLRRQPVYYEFLPGDSAGGRLGGRRVGVLTSLITRVHTSQRYMPADGATPSSLSTVWTSATCRSDLTRVTTVSMSPSELFEPPVQESSLGGRGGHLQCPAVGRPSLVIAAQPPQQLAPGRVEVEVTVQVEAVDGGQRGGGVAGLGEGDGAVELDHRGTGEFG